jgi:(2R)-sulfolactate sulfo-lyase subunit beta
MKLAKDTSFPGYRRENGSVGVRNYVALIAVDHAGAPVVDTVCKFVRGTRPVSHQYGRLQFGRDLELTFRVLIGAGVNPNVAAAVVVGIEPNWTHRIADEIERKTGKPVRTVHVVGNGTINAIAEAARHAVELVWRTSEMRREPVDVSDLVVSIKCGASDTTSGIASNPVVGVAATKVVDLGGTLIFGETTELAGGEHIIAERAANDAVRSRFLKMFNDYISFAKAQGVDIMGSQPTQENIAGGLSTIEEKALGNIQKVPDRPVQGALEEGEAPQGKGLYFMDSSSSAQEQVTLCAAAGAAVHLFSTGQGNTVGNPILPVVKVTGNPNTAASMVENIDVDVSGIVRGTMGVEEGGEKVFEEMLKVASGKMTKAEILSHDNFTINRAYKSM